MNTELNDSDIAEQRKLGVKLAKSINAPKTLEIIKDANSTIEQIFKAAEAEIGVEKLVDIVINEQPEWSFWLKRSIALGNHMKAVSDKAENLTLPPDLDSKPTSRSEQALQPVSKISLGLQGGFGGAAYVCNYTMMWQSAENVNQPIAAYPNVDDWLWSPHVRVQHSSLMNCADFATNNPKSPLKPGDPVWLWVWICAGTKIYAGGSPQVFKYKYDPNSNGVLALTGTGTTYNPIFKKSP